VPNVSPPDDMVQTHGGGKRDSGAKLIRA